MSDSNSNEISPSNTPISSSNAPKFGTLVPNRVFVGGIHTDTSEEELHQLFSQYGHVTQAKIISDRAGVSKGYGFVTFETEEEARRIQNLDSVTLKDRKLNVAAAIKKQQAFPRIYGMDISSPDTTCSSVEPSDVPLARGTVGNPIEWNAMANPNPAEPAPMPNSAVFYNNGVPYAAYPGIYNYPPSEPNPCQYQQPFYYYSTIYAIPQTYQTPTTPQVHWGGTPYRWPNQIGYEQSNSSPQTSAGPTPTSQSVPYTYNVNSGLSTPTSTPSSGQRNKPVTPTNPGGLIQNLSDKGGLYYHHFPTYAYQVPIQYAVPPHQGMGDSSETAVVEATSTESPPYNQGAFQKSQRRHPNFSPRKGPPSFVANQNYNVRHYSPQRNYKPRYYDVNASSQHYSEGKSSSGSHVGPLTPPATPMTTKTSTNGNDHITDTAHRFKTLKLRE